MCAWSFSPRARSLLGPLREQRFASGAPSDGNGGIRIDVEGTPYSTQTAADGRFRVELPPAIYNLHFLSEGYASAVAADVAVAAGAETTLPAPIVLATQPSSVRGDIALDRFGTPELIAGVTVRLLDPQGVTVGVAAVGDSGEFVLADIPAGVYEVEAILPGYVTAHRALELTVGELADVGTMLLQHASGTAQAVPLSGRVQLEGGGNLAGVQIGVRFTNRDLALVQVFTDAAGRFSVPAARDETYRLDFDKAGFQSVHEFGPVQWADPPGLFVNEAREPIDVTLAGESGAVRVVVTLPVGYEDPARLARVVVQLRPLNPDATPDQTRSEAPGADGVVVFADMKPGLYRLGASLDDAAFQGDGENVEIRPGELTLADDLTVTLAGRQPGEAPAELVGRAALQDLVDDAEGNGGILVSIATTPITAVTAPDGRFVFSGVPTGSPLTLRFQHDGYGTVTLDVEALAREEVRALDPVLLPAQPGEVRGRVALDRFGSPDALADVRVVLLDAQGVSVAAAGQAVAGAFIIPDVSAGDYTLQASLAGYQAAERGVQVGHGATTDVGGVLLQHESGTDAAVSLRGRVRLAGTDDFSGTTVRVRIAGRDVPFAQLATGPDGYFEVFASPHEAYRIDAEHGAWVGQADLGPLRWNPGSSAFRDDAGRTLDVMLAASDGPSGDTDGDGVLNANDNCAAVRNVDQADADADGPGDICDDDDDNDGLLDTEEILLGTSPLDVDTDRDGLTDLDELRVFGTSPLNDDTDGDGRLDGEEGNADTDGDRFIDALESATLDSDLDGAADQFDGPGPAGDLDGDGVLNADDNCPALANRVQIDTDADDQGDTCDEDDDEDSRIDVLDNCPLVANGEQLDFDGDRLGDACDDDDDNDGLTDAQEAALGSNPTSADTDADGVPDGRDVCPGDRDPPPGRHGRRRRGRRLRHRRR
jgi:hypothetical protein